MTAAQDEGEWCRTAEQGAERSMVKLIAAEKVGAERDGRDQEEDSPKQASSCWFGRRSWLATSGANL